MNFKLQELKAFIDESSKAGYEGEDLQYETKEADGSTTLSYESGEWKFHDNYFGGEPYGGRTVYFYKGKPVHLTVFYGYTEQVENPDEVYKFLRKSLRSADKEEFRGPKEFKEGNLLYTSKLEGDLEKFTLEEKIFRDGQEIYKAYFFGGLVDQRKGD